MMLGYVTHVMLCYITHHFGMLYNTHDMLCYITHDVYVILHICYITNDMLYNTWLCNFI